MMSAAQVKEKENKVRTVVEAFLKNKKMIREISDETGIPSSSVQRYLHDKEYIERIYGVINAKDIMEEINIRLNENYDDGVRIGGETFAKNNDYSKDSLGHFTGSKKR